MNQAVRTPLTNLQYLRAVAALMVVWLHAREQFHWLHDQFPSSAGTVGVDLFFVISGFLMVYTTKGLSISPGAFIRRRLARIAPMYWLATSVVLAVALLLPRVMNNTTLDVWHVAASYLFWPATSPRDPTHYWPLLVPGWTLNYEVMAYGLFAVAMWLARSRVTWAFSLTLIALASAGAVLPGTGAWDFYTRPIILTFVLGVLLAVATRPVCAVQRQRWGLIWLVVGVLVWYLSVLEVDLQHRLIGAGLPAMAVVAGALLLDNAPRPWLRWLEELGNASYSLYLSHVFTLAVLRLVWRRLGLDTPGEAMGWVFMVTSLLVSSLVAWLVYRWVEVRVNDLARR